MHSDVRFSDINEVGEVLIEKDNELRGRTVGDIALMYNMRIIVILRGEVTIVPMTDTVVRTNDILVVKSEKIVK